MRQWDFLHLLGGGNHFLALSPSSLFIEVAREGRGEGRGRRGGGEVVVVGREEGGRGGEKRDFMALSPNTSFINAMQITTFLDFLPRMFSHHAMKGRFPVPVTQTFLIRRDEFV